MFLLIISFQIKYVFDIRRVDTTTLESKLLCLDVTHDALERFSLLSTNIIHSMKFDRNIFDKRL